MTKLSPVAQAVLDAFESSKFADQSALAVALRAAADQVVPVKPAPDVASLKEFERWDVKRFVRLQVLAIATELEGAND